MDAYLKASFWTDERIEDLSPNEKLAALWLITNPNRDLLGFTQSSDGRFLFETGLENTSPLQGAMEALPTSFQGVGKGVYFARNFLRHQFGKGGELNMRNNVLKAAIRQALTLPRPQLDAFLEAYPELVKPLQELRETEAPCKGLRRGAGPPEQSRAEQSRESSVERGAGERPDASLVERIRTAYPRRTHGRDAVEQIEAAIRRHHGPAEDILEGTLAIAEAVLGWSPNERLQFLKTPPDFFAGDHWQDDPAWWASRRQARLSNHSPDRIQPDIGGRKPSRIASTTEP